MSTLAQYFDIAPFPVHAAANSLASAWTEFFYDKSNERLHAHVCSAILRPRIWNLMVCMGRRFPPR